MGFQIFYLILNVETETQIIPTLIEHLLIHTWF